jgi:hypothetical protein
VFRIPPELRFKIAVTKLFEQKARRSAWPRPELAAAKRGREGSRITASGQVRDSSRAGPLLRLFIHALRLWQAEMIA